MNSFWVSWNIWQISQIVTKIWDSVERCPKQWDWSWSWRIMVRGSHFGLWSAKYKVELQIEQLRSNSKLGSLIILSDVVHTRGESLQDGLRVVWICKMTLASAYMLCHLFAMWLQLQMIERSLRWEWVLIGVSLLNTGDQVQ